MRYLFFILLLLIPCVAFPLPATDPVVEQEIKVYVNSVSLTRANRLYHLKITFYVDEYNRGPESLEEGNGSSDEVEEYGPTLEDIRANKPEIFEKYVRPHGDTQYLVVPYTQSWQLFMDEFVVKEKVKKEIDQALIDFDNDDWIIRLKAQKRMSTPEYYVAIFKLSREGYFKNLSPEQYARIACSMEVGDVISEDAIEKLRNDIVFLTDCLVKADKELTVILNKRIALLNAANKLTTRPTTGPNHQVDD